MPIFALTVVASHGWSPCTIFLQASGVPTHITVAVVKVAVPLSTVFATESWIPGRDGGVGVPLPDGDRPHSLLSIPISRQSGVSLQEEREKQVSARFLNILQIPLCSPPRSPSPPWCPKGASDLVFTPPQLAVRV